MNSTTDLKTNIHTSDVTVLQNKTHIEGIGWRGTHSNSKFKTGADSSRCKQKVCMETENSIVLTIWNLGKWVELLMIMLIKNSLQRLQECVF